MTNPTITYGHAFLTDCTATVENGLTWTAAPLNLAGGDYGLTVTEGDIFDISMKPDGANDEKIAYELDIANTVATGVYSKFILRYKTGYGSLVGAAASFIDTLANEYYFLGTATVPVFNTSWTVVTGTLPNPYTIDKIRLYADDYPDATADGVTRHVYFDFLLIHEGTFTFPHVKSITPLKLHNNYARMQSGRVGNSHQYSGMDSPIFRITGDMIPGETWGGTILPYGEYLYRIFKYANVEPWQWFTSDMINCKALPIDFDGGQETDGTHARVYTMDLEMESLSSGSISNWDVLTWFGFK